MRKNILVTGAPGAGKSTLVREVVRALGVRPGGYLTRAFPARGRKIRCEIEALTPGARAARGVMASVDMPGPPRVAGMGVSAADLDAVGAAALEAAVGACPLIVMDEIGNMEAVSRRFQDAVVACMDSATPVLGVIKAGGGPFVDRIKGRADVELVEVKADRREAARARVEGMLLSLPGFRRPSPPGGGGEEAAR